jgi:DNA-binding MarR family transcriptional regulator
VTGLSSDSQEVNPAPSVEEVLGAIRALSHEIDRLDQAAADRYGLNRTDMRGLEIIGREGPVAPTQLARLLGLTTGGVTTAIDRLERAGFARRQANPDDRRRVVLETTEAAHELDAEVFGPLIRTTIQFLKTLSKTDLAVIMRYLARMQQITSAAAGESEAKAPNSEPRRRER